jgi:hypothetical protein
MRRAVIALVLASLLVGACSDDDTDEADGASTTTTAAIATSTTAVAPAAPVLKPGAIDDLGFGAPEAEVIAAVKARLGGSPEEESTQAGCESGADHTVAWLAVRLVFAEGQWQGYSWGGNDPPAATDKGVRVGSTVAELKAAYPTVEIVESSIGWEWSVEVGPDLFQTGGLTGPGTDATVDRVSSGDICAFR